jgi:hypothetical protein
MIDSKPVAMIRTKLMEIIREREGIWSVTPCGHFVTWFFCSLICLFSTHLQNLRAEIQVIIIYTKKFCFVLYQKYIKYPKNKMVSLAKRMFLVMSVPFIGDVSISVCHECPSRDCKQFTYIFAIPSKASTHTLSTQFSVLNDLQNTSSCASKSASRTFIITHNEI